MARLVIELDGFVKMLMGTGEVAELKAGVAGNAMTDQGLGAIRLGRGFAQEKLRHLAHRCGFAAVQVLGAVAASLSANSIALPRWAAASL